MNTCYHEHTNENVSEYTHTPIMYPTRTMRASDRARAVAKQNFSRLARLFALLAALFSGISFRRGLFLRLPRGHRRSGGWRVVVGNRNSDLRVFVVPRNSVSAFPALMLRDTAKVIL